MRGTRARLAATSILFGLLAAGVGHAAGAPVAAVETGSLSGVRSAGVDRFLGVPYAAAPVGDLRWRPPEPAKPWTGLRKADRFGASCPQDPHGVFASPSQTEDCLFLNIYVPAASAGKRLPVMVWFYGGGLFTGESDDYDGSALAAAGAVVVTLNYRIGALGFLSHPALNAEGHPYANYGLMDQQAALRWVKRNIAAFGGDPSKVTIFGQSGGGASVMAQLISPTARGLFQRAINQSGTHIEQIAPDKALQTGEAFATKAGCSNQSVQCLRALSVEEVLQSQGPVIPVVAAGFPMADGTVIVSSPFEAFGSGRFNRVPILTGLVGDEQAFFLDELNGGPPLKAEGLLDYLNSFGPQARARLQAAYSLANYASPSLAVIAAAQDYKVCLARTLDRMWSRFTKLYVYDFEDRRAPSYFGPVSYPMGAYHTAELQFLFPGFHGGRGEAQPLTLAEQGLASQMVKAWTGFARSGAPGGSGWRPYAASGDDVRVLAVGGGEVRSNYGRGRHCEVWDPVIAGHQGVG